MYTYIQSEPTLWTVGYYDPTGKWRPESDHDTPKEAATRTASLNGTPSDYDSLQEQVKQLQEEKKELVRVLGYANAQLSSLQGSYKPEQIGYIETAAVIKDIQSLLSKHKTT